MQKWHCTSSANEAVANMYWPDKTNSKCVKYSKMSATDLTVQLFDSAQECCKTSISWVHLPVCVSMSTGVDTQDNDN